SSPQAASIPIDRNVAAPSFNHLCWLIMLPPSKIESNLSANWLYPFFRKEKQNFYEVVAGWKRQRIRWIAACRSGQGSRKKLSLGALIFFLRPVHAAPALERW